MTTETKMPELLPCPFCGGEPETACRASDSDQGAFVAFVSCFCGGYSACAHKMGFGAIKLEATALAIAAWNRRASPSPPADVQDGVDAGLFYVACFKGPRNGHPVCWWGPNDAGYTPDLMQAGKYRADQITPGYHDSDENIPVPVSFVRDTARIRQIVDPGDSANTPFWNIKSLRAAIDSAKGKS